METNWKSQKLFPFVKRWKFWECPSHLNTICENNFREIFLVKVELFSDKYLNKQYYCFLCYKSVKIKKKTTTCLSVTGILVRLTSLGIQLKYEEIEIFKK